MATERITCKEKKLGCVMGKMNTGDCWQWAVLCSIARQVAALRQAPAARQPEGGGMAKTSLFCLDLSLHAGNCQRAKIFSGGINLRRVFPPPRGDSGGVSWCDDDEEKEELSKE